jgi:quercetin dioxygenase-like cupin family protein
MLSPAARLKPIRRIIAGLDSQGRSTVLVDSNSPHVQTVGADNFGVTDLWKTFSAPADNQGVEDPCLGPITLAPPPRGTVFRVVEFPPDKDYIATWRRDEAFGNLGESGSEAVDHSGTARHSGMHRTASVDYAFVLEGEIWAILDTTEVLLRQGDVLIQRGTNHAWSNRTSAQTLVGFVLIDAHPVPRS